MSFGLHFLLLLIFIDRLKKTPLVLAIIKEAINRLPTLVFTHLEQLFRGGRIQHTKVSTRNFKKIILAHFFFTKLLQNTRLEGIFRYTI
jgi:hypothetical protein